MSNILISNGTCYTAAGEKLNGEFIPCGNSAFGYQTCCGAGDNCLADLACFGIHGSGYGSYLTYFGGCTDPEYKDASCPKKVLDQPWVALTLCDNSDGAWAICSQSGNPATLQPGSYCSCTNSASATIAFKDATVLSSYASLPASTGETISFFAGHTPTGTPTAQATSGGGGGGGASSTGSGGGSSASPGSSGTSGTRSSATPTSGSSSKTGSSASAAASSSSAAAASSSSSGSSGSAASGLGSSPTSGSAPTSSKSSLGTGAIVGIAIGAVIVGILLAVAAFLLHRRRKRRAAVVAEKNARESALSTSPMKPGGLGEYVRPTTPTQAEVEGQPVSEVQGNPAKPWALGRSELDGKEIPKRKKSERVGGSSPYELP